MRHPLDGITVVALEQAVAAPGGEIDALLPPVEITGVDAVMRAVPALGEHTEAVRAEFGPPEVRASRVREGWFLMTDVIERTGLLLPEPANALGALLGVPVPDLGEGLPLLWHWVYLLDRPAQADLGRDGHPVRGTIPAPPGPGRRRMWAGGRVRTSGALRCGRPATKRTSVLSVTEKQGRTGHLTFVTVRHQITQDGRLALDEEQDIVYREAVAPTGESTPLRPADEGEIIPAGDGEWEIEVSPTLLFRFSALTYNAHRIHYDRDFTRDVEGYPGLLTHGPLQALAMAEAARARGVSGDLSFEYRLLSPLFDYQGLIVSATTGRDATTTSARDRHGRQTATGTLKAAS